MKQADQYLIDRYFQGTLSDEDIVAINQLLDSSREARDYFRKAALLDSALHEKASLPLPEIASPNQPHPLIPWMVAAACIVLALIQWSHHHSHHGNRSSRSKVYIHRHSSNPAHCQVD